MRYLLFFFIILVSCSTDETQNPDENPDNENPISDGRYKISFSAIGNTGEKHFKAIYKFDDNEPQIVNYDGFVSPQGFMIGDATERIDFELEMTSGTSYLSNVMMKVEDLLTNEIRYEMDILDGTNQYILSPDVLTEKDFLNNLYGTPPQSFNPRNNYKLKYHATINYGSQGSSTGENYYYDYRDDVLVHKPTRGSLRIVVDTAPLNLPSDYSLETEQNAWLIQDNSNDPNNGFLNILKATSTLSPFEDFNSNNVDKTYDLILPSHMSELTLKFRGDDANATVYLMRKDGTTETQTISTSNNQLQTINFTL
ncbi:hypothetical protein [Lacinutrix salivirga]